MKNIQTIDINKLDNVDKYDVGYTLARLLLYTKDPLFIKHDDNDLFNIILPKYEDIYLRGQFLEYLPINYIEYKGGLYLSTIDNKYCFFVKAIKGAKSITIHKDTKEIFNLENNPNIEEIIIESDSINIHSDCFNNLNHLTKLIFNKGSKLEISYNNFNNLPKLNILDLGKYDYYRIDSDCFKNLISLNNKDIEFKEGKVEIGSNCFKGCYIRNAYFNKNTTRILKCFDENTNVYYEGNLDDIEISTKLERYTQEWDGNPHHPSIDSCYLKYIKGTNNPNYHSNISYEEYLRLKDK